MKTFRSLNLRPFVLATLLLAVPAAHAAETAEQLIEKSEMHTRGKSFQAQVAMTVFEGKSSRTVAFKTWSEGRDKAVIKILEPAKDRGIGNLRLEFNLWQYLPNVERIVKIPPSMMLQSWMGSDFTNDDLVKSSSLSRDYTHAIEKKESLNGVPAIKIVCTAKPTAPVTWGKVIVWLRDPDAVPLKQESYSENGELLKVMEGSEIKTFGSHIIPTKLTMRTLKKNDSRTELTYKDVVFDEKIPANVFTQEFIRRAQK